MLDGLLGIYFESENLNMIYDGNHKQQRNVNKIGFP